MFLKLIFLMTFVPLAELWLLVELTRRTSHVWTIALVLSTGIIGMSLVRWQGPKAWRQIQQQLSPSRSAETIPLSSSVARQNGWFSGRVAKDVWPEQGSS